MFLSGFIPPALKESILPPQPSNTLFFITALRVGPNSFHRETSQQSIKAADAVFLRHHAAAHHGAFEKVSERAGIFARGKQKPDRRKGAPELYPRALLP